MGKEDARDQRAWLRGRLRTAWVQGWLEMGGEKKPLVMSELGCADGCGREMGAELRARLRTAWVLGAREWLEMGREKKPLEPLVMSELGCADSCGRAMGAELRNRLPTAWVQRSGWKWVGRRSRW